MDRAEGIGRQSIEDFWGAELSAKQKKVKWEAEEDDKDEMDDIFTEKTLELRQACLGVSAKEGERNIVQLTAENEEGEIVKHTILSLRVGGTEQCSLFLTLNPPVAFELVSGSGPVHIVGSSVETFNMLNDSDDESDEDDDLKVPSPAVEMKALLGSAKKRPANSQWTKPAKVIKLDKSSGESTADTSMETSSSIVSPKKKKPTQKEEPDEDDDEDDEEDDDEEDIDDEDMFSDEEDEEDDEDDDEDEDEIEEVKPPTKKPQSNGKAKGKGLDLKNKIFKTPPAQKQPPKASKMSMSAPPKQSEKKVAVKGGISIDDAKKKLLKQLPNVPKKLEKFNNYIGNSFKIKDDSVKKQLWEFVQKSR